MSSSSSEVPTISLVENLKYVKDKMQHAKEKCDRNSDEVTLVAVSKTKPAEDIKVLYDAGHRVFGENYYQEIVEKSSSSPLNTLNDIQWHFIGHLQSAKASKLLREVPNLAVIETVDTLKLAVKLNNACASINRTNLNIFIQVHTSYEETKSGVTKDELLELVTAIRAECPHLTIKGLMTIGAPGDFTCFDKLALCREEVAIHLNTSTESLELSMGMSGDFEEAIERGATSIRVGSTLFGARDYSK